MAVQPRCAGSRALTDVTTAPHPIPSDVSDTAGDRLLLAGEVAELLQVSPAWVYAETRADRIPHLRLGRYVRYRRSAIDAWLLASERPPFAPTA
jgi:excisionase family DNA binding protein